MKKWNNETQSKAGTSEHLFPTYWGPVRLDLGLVARSQLAPQRARSLVGASATRFSFLSLEGFPGLLRSELLTQDRRAAKLESEARDIKFKPPHPTALKKARRPQFLPPEVLCPHAGCTDAKWFSWRVSVLRGTEVSFRGFLGMRRAIPEFTSLQQKREWSKAGTRSLNIQTMARPNIKTEFWFTVCGTQSRKPNNVSEHKRPGLD